MPISFCVIDARIYYEARDVVRHLQLCWGCMGRAFIAVRLMPLFYKSYVQGFPTLHVFYSDSVFLAGVLHRSRKRKSSPQIVSLVLYTNLRASSLRYVWGKWNIHRVTSDVSQRLNLESHRLRLYCATLMLRCLWWIDQGSALFSICTKRSPAITTKI